jgi:hypothetical protein
VLHEGDDDAHAPARGGPLPPCGGRPPAAPARLRRRRRAGDECGRRRASRASRGR